MTREKTGGRLKGTLNKSKQRLLKTLQAEYGEDFNPIMRMAAHADAIDGLVKNPPQDCKLSEIERRKIAIDAWDKIAAYTTAKLKTIELSVSDGEGIPIQHIWEHKVVQVLNPDTEELRDENERLRDEVQELKKEKGIED